MKLILMMKRCANLMAAGAIALLSGCSHEHDQGNGHSEHDHGDEPIMTQVTVFGDRHEIFAEHQLVVAGNPTKFVTHVTDLKTLEPRRDGSVRFIMRLGEEPPIEQVEKEPKRPGIYEPMLTFPKPGDWNLTLTVSSDDGERSIAFPVIKAFPDAHTAEHAEIPEPAEGIQFLKEQQWKIKAGTEPATRRKLVEQLRLPATVMARPGAIAQVTPPVAGRLLLPAGKQMPGLGEKVEAGQVLALIQPSFSEISARFVEAEGEVVRSRLALDQAETALKRVEQLAKAEAKSGRELQEAQFDVKIARAKHEAALALQSMFRRATANARSESDAAIQPAIELRSPIPGTITAQLGAAVGEHVTAERPVFTVLDPDTVFIEARIPEGGINRFGGTKAASYEVPGQAPIRVPITAGGAGRLVYAGIQVDPQTRTLPLVYEVKNADGRLRVGQSLTLYVETARMEEALAIPHEAVLEEAGRPVAFVQLAGETFQKRDLTLGIRDGNWVQVLSGINEGERVVSSGAYAVRLASLASALPSHGHAH